MLVQPNKSCVVVLPFLKQVTCAFFFCFVTITAQSQAVPVKTAHPKNPPKVPSWVSMMDDPNVNYYEAVKAFNSYWKNKIKPAEEDEMDESPASANEILTKRQARQRAREKEREERRRLKLTTEDATIKYAFEYKRFLHWQLEMEPFVQPDGHIKNMDDRVKEWESQKDLKHKQEQKNRKKQSDSTHQKNEPHSNQ